MQYRLPRPAVTTLLIQCLIMMAAGVALFLFLNARQEQRALEAANRSLAERRHQLQQAKKRVDDYRQFLSSHPFYAKKLQPPQWERISVQWRDLAFSELLDRLAMLYQPERPFVLERFSVAPAGNRQTATPDPGQDGSAVPEPENSQKDKQIFKLEGFFLCPCR